MKRNDFIVGKKKTRARESYLCPGYSWKINSLGIQSFRIDNRIPASIDIISSTISQRVVGENRHGFEFDKGEEVFLVHGWSGVSQQKFPMSKEDILKYYDPEF